MPLRGLEITDISITLCPMSMSNKTLGGFARMVLNDALVINGIRIVLGKSGPFVSYPREVSQRKDKCYNIFFPIKRDIHEHMNEAILSAYREALEAQTAHQERTA